MTDKLLSLAREAGAHISPAGFVEFTEHDDLTAFAERIRQEERERAARICEDEQVDAEGSNHREDVAYNLAIEHCIEAIRSSGTSGSKSDE